VHKQLSQIEAQYFVELLNFVCQAFLSYQTFPEIKQSVIEVVPVVLSLFRSEATDEIHHLMDALIDFVTKTVPVYSDVYDNP